MTPLSGDPHRVWNAVVGELQLTMSTANFTTWIKPTRILSWEKNLWVIGVPTAFCKHRIEVKYQPLMEKILSQHLGEPTKLQCRIAPLTTETPAAGMFAEKTPLSLQDVPLSGIAQEASPPANGDASLSRNPGGSLDGIQAPKESRKYNPQVLVKHLATQTNGVLGRYTFDSFIVGDNNKMAHAASVAVAEHPGEAYNPLFIYGGVGLGKTHLMRAITKYVRERNPHYKIIYESSEKFTNELIAGIRGNQTENFRNKYRTVNLLLIDDIQFIAGKETTQEEFFHTFNAVYEGGGQVVLSSDRPPQAIPTLQDRLRSRFSAGLITDIQKPNFETRAAILSAKAKDLNIPEEVLHIIADKVKNNIRDLEGALNKVVTHCKVHNIPYSREIVLNLLTTFEDQGMDRKISLPAIIDMVADYYHTDTATLKGTSRKKEFVLPRQVAMYLMREYGKISLNQIGAELGGKDHTTVMHSCQKIEELLKEDTNLKNEVALLVGKLST